MSWSGSDDAGGSGIATYDVFVSTDGGPFTPFLTGTTATSATFTGAPGHTYGFYSVATDNVGNRQATPTAAQATLTVVSLPQTNLFAVSGSGTFAGTATLTATLTFGGSPLAGKTVTFTLINGTASTNVGSATTDASGVATLGGVSLAGWSGGTSPGAVMASFAGDASFAGTNASGDLSIQRLTPTVTWPIPADIIYGTPLARRSSMPRPPSRGPSPTPRPQAPSCTPARRRPCR